MYVPLKLMYPEAQITCLQLSLLKNLDPCAHIALGKSLTSLRNKNVLIIGSGFSFHNLELFFKPERDTREKGIAFDNWLVDTCSNPDLSVLQRVQQLIAWAKAPYARYCHPREEHRITSYNVCYTKLLRVRAGRRVHGGLRERGARHPGIRADPGRGAR